MESPVTDEEKLEHRRQERALCSQGLVRTSAYLANYGIKADVPIVRGPKILGSINDQGLWVPAWFEWFMKRFPDSVIHGNLRHRLEALLELKHDKGKQLMLLYEANLAGGTLYEPLGDISTKHAIDLLEKELGDEAVQVLGQTVRREEDDSEHRAGS